MATVEFLDYFRLWWYDAVCSLSALSALSALWMLAYDLWAKNMKIESFRQVRLWWMDKQTNKQRLAFLELLSEPETKTLYISKNLKLKNKKGTIVNCVSVPRKKRHLEGWIDNSMKIQIVIIFWYIH